MPMVYRGNPAMAAASSLIVPTNENLVLRGRFGQQLLAAYGPVPQNTLLRQGRRLLGSVFPLQVTAPHAGIAARWYVAVTTPAGLLSSAAMTALAPTVMQTLQAAVAMAASEQQLPCVLPSLFDQDDLYGAPGPYITLRNLLTDAVPSFPDALVCMTDNPALLALFDYAVRAHAQPLAEAAPVTEDAPTYDLADDTPAAPEEVPPLEAPAPVPAAAKRGRPPRASAQTTPKPKTRRS